MKCGMWPRYSPGKAIVRLRGDASEAWLKRTRLTGFHVIHLATHALVDESSSRALRSHSRPVAVRMDF